MLCQCFSVKLSEREQEYIAFKYDGCLCAACMLDLKVEYQNQKRHQTIQTLLGKNANSKNPEPTTKISKRSELAEGEHYYINEQGYWVFTEKYHLLKGYCCDNGCKHCPY